MKTMTSNCSPLVSQSNMKKVTKKEAKHMALRKMVKKVAKKKQYAY